MANEYLLRKKQVVLEPVVSSDAAILGLYMPHCGGGGGVNLLRVFYSVHV
jgi:hypothetical protein